MLKLDTLRGDDSTGVLSVLHDKKTKIFKDVGTVWDLMKWKQFDDTVDRRASALLLGHNRAATKGKVTPENAHPFDYDGFIGVHNGTLRGQWRLDNHKEFDVDSENIYYHMGINGVADTLSKLEGAFALAFYDKEQHKLTLVRNKERPLCYAFSEDAKTMFFASEGWMITVACGRNNIKIGEIFDVTPEKIYRFDVPDVSGDMFKGYDGKWSKEDATFFTAPPTQSHWNGGRNSSNYTGTYGRTEEKKPGTNIIPFDPKNTAAVARVMQRSVGRLVEFSIESYVEAGKKQPNYFKASTEDEDLFIKIFVEKKTPLYKTLLNSCCVFRGRIKGFGTYNDRPYFTLDHRSIEEIKDGEVKYYGFENKPLAMTDWRDRTAKGCAVCETIPTTSDAAVLEWFDDNDHLCFNCQGTHTGSMLVSARQSYNSRKES
jgi:hypothetical protein